MEKRFERETKDMTALPEEEEAIFSDSGRTFSPAGKTVLEYCLPVLETPDGRILAGIFPCASKARRRCASLEKRRGKDHAASEDCRGASGARGHPCGLYAAELRGTAGA